MSIHRKKIFERKGEGILRPENETTEIPVKFTCVQYFDGIIEGTIELIEEDQVKYLKTFFETEKFSLFVTLENEEINIEKLLFSHVTNRWGETIEIRDIRFITNKVELRNREISSNSSKKFCKFAVSNLESFRTVFDTGIGNVSFFMYDNHKDIWEDIKTYKKSSVNGTIQITLNDDIKLDTVDEYKSLLYEEIEKILFLSCLAQGVYVDWASFELFEQIGEGYERVYSERRTIRSTYLSSHHLIYTPTLTQFFNIAHPKYDVLKRDLGFNYAISWYLDAISIPGAIESKYIRIFTVLELFVSRFASLNGTEYILGEDVYTEFSEQLKPEMKRILEGLEIGSGDRGHFYGKLIGLNRHSLRTNLTSFLQHHNIGYSDIIEDLGTLIYIRNNIIHRGLSDTEFGDLVEVYNKLVALIQRIFLTILDYEGNYYSWITNNSEPFNRNPNNDFAK